MSRNKNKNKNNPPTSEPKVEETQNPHADVTPIITDQDFGLDKVKEDVAGIITDLDAGKITEEEATKLAEESIEKHLSSEEPKVEEAKPEVMDKEIGNGVNSTPEEVKKLGGIAKLRERIKAKREAAKAAKQPRV